MTWRNRIAALIAPERRSSLSLPALTGLASNAMAINARAAENLSAVTACTAVVAGALSACRRWSISATAPGGAK